MARKMIFKCLALVYLVANYAHAVDYKKGSQGVLDSEKPEEFVEETEKQVKEVNHIRVISDAMTKYLSNNTLDTSKFCDGELGTCKTIVERFVTRCKMGDCYSLDNMQVFSVPGKLTVLLPHLAQVEAAKFIFKKSGARQAWYKRFRDVFRTRKGKRSTIEFNKEMLRRNLDKMSLEDASDVALVTESLYSTTLYYQRYLNRALLASLHNKNRFTRAMFKMRHRKNLIRLVDEVIAENRLTLSHSNLKSLMDSYVLYLVVGNYKPLYRLSLTFSDLVKHSISKAMGYRKVDFMMADYMLRYPVSPNKYCMNNAEATCKAHLTDFLSRCDEGDCTSLDKVSLLDPKDWMDVKLPELPEVSVSVDLFLGSRAKAPNPFLRLILNRWNRLSTEQFKDLLYQRNAGSMTYTTKNQGALHRLLNRAAFEFMFRAKGALPLKTVKNAKGTLMDTMLGIAGRDKVFLPVTRVAVAFKNFRNYLVKSGLDVPLNDVNSFARDAQLVLFSYLEDPHKGEYTDEFSKEWEALKEAEAEQIKKDLEKELAAKEPKQPSGFKKLWNKLTGKEEVTEEEEKSIEETVKEAKDKLNAKVETALEEFNRSVTS